MGAKIETIIKIYNIYFYYCPKKYSRWQVLNDLND